MLLKNCRIHGDEITTDILIAGGKIKEIKKGIHAKGKVIDLAGRYVFPGLIDPHVHFREPGLTHKEDFFTGSCAAAAGGITTFLDMPNTMPPTMTVEILEEKKRLAKKSIVNYGLYFGAGADNSDEIRKARNIAGVKLYMNNTTGKHLVTDDDDLRSIFQAAKFVAVHAEGPMVAKAMGLAAEYGTKLYLCHISERRELDYIRNNRTDSVFVEVTPHHLFLEERGDGFTKMIPCLKTEDDRKALLDAINRNEVDTIGTDHAPHLADEKLSAKPPAGIPSCEIVLALLLDSVNKGKMSLQKVIDLCCHNPAKIFGIRNKGYLLEGYDADLCVVDMDLVKKVSKAAIHTKCGWSPYEGRELQGWPIMTFVNGNIVFDNGKINDIKAREVEFDG